MIARFSEKKVMLAMSHVAGRSGQGWLDRPAGLRVELDDINHIL